MRCSGAWWIPDDRTMSDRTDPGDTKGGEWGQIEMVLEHCKERELVLQAGARIGVWPKSLSKVFKHVVTLEPEPDNAQCCELNLHECSNVRFIHAALGATVGTVTLRKSNISGGEHYVTPATKWQNPGRPGRDFDALVQVPMVTIDSLDLPACSAIFLDVEGLELEVFKGAELTLQRFHPTLCYEENVLVSRYGGARGDVEQWLKKFGYSRVAEWTTLPPEIQNDGGFHGSDIILAAP